MRILVIGARGVPGGDGDAERHAERLFAALAGADEVRLLALAAGGPAPGPRGVRIDRVPGGRWFGPVPVLYHLWSLGWAARWRGDIVHCQGLSAAGWVWFYRWVGRRVVVRYGADDRLDAGGGVLDRLGARWCERQLRAADAVVAATPSVRERLSRAGVAGRVVVVPDAVDEVGAPAASDVLARFDLTPGAFVLAVGRTTAAPDLATLVRAFEAARAREPALGQLVVVGTDDGAGTLARLRARAGAAVVVTGPLSRGERGALFAACRLYVDGARAGPSRAVLEAVSHGCPILVSDVADHRALPLAASQFFARGDVAALAERLREAVADAPAFTVDRDAFASWPEVAARTRRLYAALLARPRRAAAAPAEPLVDDGAPSP